MATFINVKQRSVEAYVSYIHDEDAPHGDDSREYYWFTHVEVDGWTRDSFHMTQEEAELRAAQDVMKLIQKRHSK